MALGKRLINTGAAAAAGCTTDSVQAFGADAAYSSNIALYQFEDNANDTTTNYNGTASNVTYATGKFGNAALFNGSSSKIVVSDSSDNLNFSNHTGTISAWVNLDSISGGEEPVVNKRDTGNPGNRSYLFNVTNGVVNWYTYNTDSNQQQVSSTSSLSASQWHHIVVTLDQTNIKIYIDGVLDKTASSTYTSIQDDGADFTIGYRGNNSGHVYADGSIDQVRIFNKAISAEDVATLYNETSSTASNTNPFSEGAGVALYSFDYDASEASGYYDGTPSNVDFGVGGKINYGARFNGSSSIINTSVDFDTLTDYTISMWINPSSNNKYFAGTVAASTALNGIYLNLTSGNLIRFFERNNSNTVTSLTSTDTVTLNAWNHIVVVRDGSTNYIYVNNGTPVSLSNSTITHTTDFTIGRAGAFTSTYFDGSIDQVRIFSTALSSSQVTELYNEKGETDTSNFKTVLYEGNGGSQYISNVGFEPDLVWIKERTGSAWHILTDSVRGANKTIYSNDTYQEESLTNVMNSFESNGFMVAYNSAYSSVFSNKNNESYVAWVFKGGGEAVQNTQGNNINSDVSANDKGFSIVKYTAGSTIITDTVGHGVNVNGVATKPDLIIQKVTSVGSTNWFAITDVIDSSFDWLMFNDTAGKTDMSGIYANFDIGTTTFTNWYASGSGDVITYCFSSVAGYSKIGSYTSTGSAGLEITNLGFAPSFVMIKNVSDVGSWIIHSKPPTTTNPSVYHLRANSSNAQDSGTSEQIDFDSDGFTLNGTGQNINHSHGDTYIYMAFK